MSRKGVALPKRIEGEALEKKKHMNLLTCIPGENMAKHDPWILPAALSHGDGIAFNLINEKIIMMTDHFNVGTCHQVMSVCREISSPPPQPPHYRA